MILMFLTISCSTAGGLIKNGQYSTLYFDVLEDQLDLDLTADIKIVHISDLHFTRKKVFYEKAVRTINLIKPDILFITGDSVEYIKEFTLLEDFLRKLDPEIIKYSILGNHEYWGDIKFSKLQELYAKYQCRLLINEGDKASIKNQNFHIFGTDELTESKTDLQNFQPDAASVNIILTHCPEVFDQICARYPDQKLLVFSGHTHGGEITFFGKPLFLPAGTGSYVKGKFVKNQNILYVSKGISSGGILDVRIFANRDMILLKLKN